jgi:guanylate kinase
MNQLQRISEFRSVLLNYQLSESAKQTLAQTKLVLLVGPTSSGRNTVINKLLENGGYHYIVSDTTREKRVKDGVPIEQDGREYWFRSEEDILGDIQSGEFLEAAVIHEQQVSGISIREIEKAHNAGLIGITDIEPNGAEWIHSLKPDATILFVVPPNFDAWIARLKRRSDLPEDEIRRRLTAACWDISAALERDYYIFIVNDELETTVNEVDTIAKQGAQESEKQQRARQVAERLYAAAQQYLGQTS